MPASDAARIGLVLHDFPAGGSERIAIRLANHWAARGRDVTIFCGADAGPARERVGAAVRVVEASPAIPRGFASRVRLGRVLPAMLARHPVDVLVAPGNYHLFVLRVAERLPCAVVCKLSNPLVRPARSIIGQGAFDHAVRRAALHVDELVAMSPALADEATRLLRRPVVTLPEPILADATAPRLPGDGPPLVICAGRLVRQKNVALVLAALAQGPRHARLVVLGDGPDRQALEHDAARLGIADRVAFEGNVPDIAPWLARADALMLGSRFEGYPAVLVEAIAAGVPVVTTDSSVAIPEILAHPSFGRMTAATPAGLARGLADVLRAGPIDEAARRAVVARHAAGVAGDRWLDMLDRTVDARRPRRAA